MTLDELLKIETDCVVLSTGFVPSNDLFKKLGLPVEDDFPVNYVCSSLSPDANPHGVYLAGCSSYPKDVTQSLVSADYIAGNLAGILTKETIPIPNPITESRRPCRRTMPVTSSARAPKAIRIPSSPLRWLTP